MKKGESVLIITDGSADSIANAIYAEASSMTVTVLMKIAPTGDNGKEPSALAAKAMKESDAVIAVMKHSLTHTAARKNACKAGARVVTMPGINESIFTRTIDIDYEKLRETSEKVSAKLRSAKKVLVETESGTSFQFHNDGERVSEDDGDFSKKGSFGNLPAGEVFTAPLEKTSGGTIVIDSMGDMCRPKTRALVEKGEVKEIEGDDAFRERMFSLRNARNIAEFGIGLNSKAAISDEVLESEKVRGTCHIAFGSSFGIKGKVKAEVHWDGIIIAPTVYFDDEKIMDRGELLI